MEIELTPRQQEILRHVVEDYVSTGQPVGSKALVERSGLDVSPSTVRNEFAALEAGGLLMHPHTSAGRIPTEQGYRLYADGLLERVEGRPGGFPLDLSDLRSEIEQALQATTEMLSEVTRLLALVSAPPLEAASVRHVELLLLQPDTVIVVVITSAGGVTKRAFTFSAPVDPGLAAWAREYLNESLAGVQLATSVFRRRFDDPGLGPRERAFLDALRPAFDHLAAQDQRLFVGGAAGLLGDARADELEACQRLLEVLEQRASVLRLIGEAIGPRRAYVRVGEEELDNPALRDVALVGSTYGLANRPLGAVSLLGPVRMDYEKALRTVRGAAHELSRFIEQVYDEN